MKKLIVILTVAVMILAPAAFAPSGPSGATAAFADDAARIAEGKDIAFRRRAPKEGGGVGNCLACHVIAGGESPGNMGPPLIAIEPRFPNRADLRARLYDATQFNPISAMPPFGKHNILTAEEIEKVIDFLYTL